MSSADLLMSWVKKLIDLMVANGRNPETGPVVEHFAITQSPQPCLYFAFSQVLAAFTTLCPVTRGEVELYHCLCVRKVCDSPHPEPSSPMDLISGIFLKGL